MNYYLVIVAVFILLVYKWLTKDNDYFIKRGIPALKPTFMLGNTGKFYTKQIGLIDLVTKLYNDFPDEK